jgi:hypothetical protein
LGVGKVTGAVVGEQAPHTPSPTPPHAHPLIGPGPRNAPGGWAWTLQPWSSPNHHHPTPCDPRPQGPAELAPARSRLRAAGAAGPVVATGAFWVGGLGWGVCLGSGVGGGGVGGVGRGGTGPPLPASPGRQLIHESNGVSANLSNNLRFGTRLLKVTWFEFELCQFAYPVCICPHFGSIY